MRRVGSPLINAPVALVSYLIPHHQLEKTRLAALQWVNVSF